MTYGTGTAMEQLKAQTKQWDHTDNGVLNSNNKTIKFNYHQNICDEFMNVVKVLKGRKMLLASSHF